LHLFHYVAGQTRRFTERPPKVSHCKELACILILLFESHQSLTSKWMRNYSNSLAANDEATNVKYQIIL